MGATKRELKKFVKDLENIKGRHTELVSVYVPAGYDIIKIIQHLNEEQGTAKNIKDAKTRSNVIDSLEKCIRHLRVIDKTPENGLAVFAGNVAAQEGKVDIKVWSIEPPDPLNIRMYRCDNMFVLEPLMEMMEHKDTYGLVVMDRREATIGFLKGTLIKKTLHLTSGVPGKFKAGGQCCMPDTLVWNGKKIAINNVRVGDQIKGFDFENNKLKYSKCLDFWKVKKDSYLLIKTENSEIRCSQDHVFFVFNEDKIVEKPAQNLREDDFVVNEKLGPEKIEFIETKNETVEMVDISVKNQNFIANGLFVHNSAARFERLIEGMALEFYRRIADACKQEFFDKKDLKGILVGGPGPTKEKFIEQLQTDLRNKVIAVEDITYTDESGLNHLVEKSKDVLKNTVIVEEKNILRRFFETLGKNPSMASYGKKDVMDKLEMGAVEVVLISDGLDDHFIEEVERKAVDFGTEIKLISTDTVEGRQLLDLGGIGAILRYAVSG